MTIKIIVAHHKENYSYSDKIHIPIHVGKELSKINLGILPDNSYLNISKLNPFYCELTATYWAWKNINSDYIGICHYRRYFLNQFHFMIFTKNTFLFYYHFLKSFILKSHLKTLFYNQVIVKNCEKEKSIKDFSEWIENNANLNSVDIYALKPVRHFNKKNLDLFIKMGSKYIFQLKEIVQNIYPEYTLALNKTLDSNYLHNANMIIMKKKYYYEYCEFIFGVLQKHFELNNTENSYNNSYLRIPGYMGELLTNTFIIHKSSLGLKLKLLNTLFIKE
jgi:hypothetical protein